MGKKDRGKVWLAAGGLVINEKGDWLVVKKRYGGLNGKWSLPAGFVSQGETIDEAAIREVKEETGIDCRIIELVGFRTGVIRGDISDNMAIFTMEPIDPTQVVVPEHGELYEAAWMSPMNLKDHPLASLMLKEFTAESLKNGIPFLDGLNPGNVFEYTSYRLFIKK